MVAYHNEGRDTIQEIHGVHAVGTERAGLAMPKSVKVEDIFGAVFVVFEWKQRAIVRDGSGAVVHMYQLPSNEEVMLVLQPDSDKKGGYTAYFGAIEGVFSIVPQECDEEAGQELDWQLCDKCQQWFVLTQDDLQCPVCNPREKE